MIIYAGVAAVMTYELYHVMSEAFSETGPDPEAPPAPMGRLLRNVLLIQALPPLVAGVALLLRVPGARILGFVAAVMALINFPVGTIFGVWVIAVLANSPSDAQVQQVVVDLRGGPPR